MTYKVLVATTDGPSREDGNVYYSKYYMVHDPLGKMGESNLIANNLDSEQDIIDWVEQRGGKLSQVLDPVFYTLDNN